METSTKARQEVIRDFQHEIASLAYMLEEALAQRGIMPHGVQHTGKTVTRDMLRIQAEEVMTTYIACLRTIGGKYLKDAQSHEMLMIQAAADIIANS